nr:MAG TPA: hypothetical protein [Caudoviricetes sp.]
MFPVRLLHGVQRTARSALPALRPVLLVVQR